MIGQQHLKGYLRGAKVGNVVANTPAVPPQRAALVKAVAANPRQQERLRWQQMTPAEKEARGMDFVRQTWHAAKGLYGGGTMPTTVPALPGSGNLTVPKPDGSRYVQLAHSELMNLARPKFFNPKERANAREGLLHEWDHYYQSPAIFNDPDTQHREEAATLFSTYWGHKLFGAQPMLKRGAIPYQNRHAASTDLASAYGPGYWRSRQFTP